MRSQLSLEKKIIKFEVKLVSMPRNENRRKIEFFWKKMNFSQNFKIHQKKWKNRDFFSQKNENSFSIKITSIGRKIILKLYSKSYESTVSALEALNAPKSFLYVLARLKVQSLLFSAKNSRIFDFQILKMARLKAVNTRSVPTCAISSMDPKVTSPMISKHSDAFRPRNAPFF